MSKTAITSLELAPPVGPFSQAVDVGGFIFVSGQVGQDRRRASWWREALRPRRTASSRISRRCSRRPARVSMMSCESVCFSRA